MLLMMFLSISIPFSTIKSDKMTQQALAEYYFNSI